MADLLQKYYSQVKNPNPVFTPREGAGTLKFCEKLMEKAVASPPVLISPFMWHMPVRRDCVGACHRYCVAGLLMRCCRGCVFTMTRWPTASSAPSLRWPLSADWRRSLLPETLHHPGLPSLTFLAELGLITYQTEYDPLIGCYIPTDITFTLALFAALDVSEDAVAAARRSRVEWENKQRKKQGLDTLGMDELIAKAWRFVRERFRSYQTELKSRGIKRARAHRDANRERQDIVTLVKRQLTREISEGRFTASREAVKREVERRVKERMILSRNRNYSRLATASP